MKASEALRQQYQLEPASWKRGRNRLAALALAGWGACALGYAAEPKRMAVAYLIAFLYFLTLALGAWFFVMVQHLSGAVWSVTCRRIAENSMATLPAAALLFLPVAFNIPLLYQWSHADAAADPLLSGKQLYLNPAAFLLRAAVYLLIWSLFSRRLHGLSLALDRGAGPAALRSAARWSAGGLVLAVVTVTFAAFDWIMSLTPHWYSTVFGVYLYAGGAAGFMAALIVGLLMFRRAGRLENAVRIDHYHDLGKWLFALIVFWAYIAFSQYMLIWYANLPEETVWYRMRIGSGWGPVALLLGAGHFLIPFFALISRAGKRNLAWLGAVALWMLAMHYLDLYWLVAPAFYPAGPVWGWREAAALGAAAGSLGLAFWFHLRRAALVPAGDPRLAASLEFDHA